MSASPRYYECIDDTFEQVESRLEALASDPDITGAEGVLNVTFGNGESDADWFDTRTDAPFRDLLCRELEVHANERFEW
jgi:frataxin-like iron-binding protein CyaY